MTPMKLDVMVVLFCYSGNGGVASTIPQLVWWVAKNYLKMKQDERIGNVYFLQICDTPITMTRNRAVRAAQEQKCDLLLMLDSDNEPDGYLGVDPEAKPFWDTAFDLAYGRLLQGKPTVAFAPYCGVPPHPIKGGEESAYMFLWSDNESDTDKPQRRIDMLSRNEAAILRGVHPLAGGPTGVSLWTLNAFEGLPKPYFQYGFNEDGSEKHTTEDCFATRNVSLFWQMKTGDNPVMALCDCWALHHKTKVVGRPRITPVESIAADFREALLADQHIGASLRNIDFSQPPADAFDAQAQEAVKEQIDALLKPEKQNGHKSNGHAVHNRLIGQHAVKTLGEPLPTADVDAIGDLVSMTGQQAGGRPLRMACLWAGDGQVPLAMLAQAPENSVVYCLGLATDSLDSQELFISNTAHVAEQCRVVDGDPLKQGEELLGEALDVVLCAGPLAVEALSAWLGHVVPDGVFASLYVIDETIQRRIASSNVRFIQNTTAKEPARVPAE